MRTLGPCERGTASVETVVLLPFFVVLFAGVLYLHRLGASHQQVTAAVRACAWTHALAGCPDQAPAVCHGTASDRQRAQGGKEQLADVAEYHDATSKLGFLGDIVEGFLGEPFVSSRDAEVAGLFRGDEKATVAAGQVLLCNPRPPSFTQFVKEIFAKKETL